MEAAAAFYPARAIFPPSSLRGCSPPAWLLGTGAASGQLCPQEVEASPARMPTGMETGICKETGVAGALSWGGGDASGLKAPLGFGFLFILFQALW